MAFLEYVDLSMPVAIHSHVPHLHMPLNLLLAFTQTLMPTCPCNLVEFTIWNAFILPPYLSKI